MREFADLYQELDGSTKTNEKVAALRRFFESASPEDAAWALYFLSGRRLKRFVASPKLHGWAAERARIPMWLFQECHDAVGDLAETIAHVLPHGNSSVSGSTLTYWIEQRLLPLVGKPEEVQQQAIMGAWSELDSSTCFVFNKLLTGAFRVGVSQELVVRAIGEASGIPSAVISHRLMGDWQPSGEFYRRLTAVAESEEQEISRPYPLALAHPLSSDPGSDADLAALGDPSEWFAEWKWDGIRAQVIRRGGKSFVWSRGDELITDRFPEIRVVADSLPDGTVLDGEIVAFRDERPLRFLDLQRRIGRKTVGKKLLAEVPVVLLAFDILEWQGQDIRDHSLWDRRRLLEALFDTFESDDPVRLSRLHSFETWNALGAIRQESREHGVEGMMLKRRNSIYGVGRKRGLWWKWKLDPLTIDAVLVYAQRGSGKRASLYSDYTFAVWQGEKLVPIAKAYSGLTDAEIARVDRFVRANTQEKFGPVRTVKPELVMELAFEGIQESSRHKSGIAVRFPRIARWRHDKAPEEADSVESIRALLQSVSPEP